MWGAVSWNRTEQSTSLHNNQEKRLTPPRFKRNWCFKRLYILLSTCTSLLEYFQVTDLDAFESYLMSFFLGKVIYAGWSPWKRTWKHMQCWGVFSDTARKKKPASNLYSACVCVCTASMTTHLHNHCAAIYHHAHMQYVSQHIQTIYVQTDPYKQFAMNITSHFPEVGPSNCFTSHK